MAPFNGLDLKDVRRAVAPARRPMCGVPMWKDGQTPKTRRARRRRALSTKELSEKHQVRNRDSVCRWPRCGCQRPKADPMKAVPTVSHDFHKGMGGNPTGDVSIAALMILFCKWRHQDAPVSRHARTLRTTYLTPDNNDGPLAFEIDRAALSPGLFPKGTWFEVARETYADDESDRLVLLPLTEEQEAVLDELAEMVR